MYRSGKKGKEWGKRGTNECGYLSSQVDRDPSWSGRPGHFPHPSFSNASSIHPSNRINITHRSAKECKHACAHNDSNDNLLEFRFVLFDLFLS